MECWSAGLGDCTAEAPFDVAQDRLRARSKEFLTKRFSKLCELWGSVLNNSSSRKPRITKNRLHEFRRRSHGKRSEMGLDARGDPDDGRAEVRSKWAWISRYFSGHRYVLLRRN